MQYESTCAYALEVQAPHLVGTMPIGASWQLHDREDDATAADLLLRCYLAGWSEANPAKICAATADGYRFHDPLAGTFSQRSLPRYFELLRTKFARTGATRPTDLAFSIRGPMEIPAHRDGMKYWREATAIGLTGVTQISVTNRGVVAETVAYDLNLASDLLRDSH